MPEMGNTDADRIWGDDLPPVEPGFGSLPIGAEGRGGIEFGPLLEAMRLVQDRFIGSALPAEVELALTDKLTAIAEELGNYQVRELERVDGRRPDLPGRGSLLVPPFTVDELTSDTMRGRVTFTRFHLGGNGAVHGGTPPLIFDDVLGKIANHAMPGVARTVNLDVDYRAVTPIGVEVFFEATRDRVEGRKRFTSARVTSADGTLLTEARGLFIELKPGQP
jgi:acyl-coenzyme A thioesterase PaaI-like protein